ncbi:kinase-like protein [Suillus brevipes Sb2]|nr:kinase-like protein [Suillus brevipes Sb2]
MSIATHTSEAPRIPLASFPYGPFRVLRTLGEGGYGKAVAVEDIPSNRLMCIKVFQKDDLKHKSTGESILKELGAYKRLASAMPCPATQFLMGLELSFQTKLEICFAMDLMANDLCHLMISRSSYCFQHAFRWTVQIALGINALHEIGIIHRDIKAENILIDVRENVRIADFGLSYMAVDARPLNRQGTYSTNVVGTPYCMAPEIVYNISKPGSTTYGPPVDWWALGCIIFQLMSHKHKARFASSFAAILLIQFFQALFETERHTLLYAAWCRVPNRTHKEFPIFKGFPPNLGDLISGLMDPRPSSRYGFREVSEHEILKWEFVDAYSRALERSEVPESLPDLRCGQKTARVWQRLAPWEHPRVPNVDWFKPV